MYIAKSIADLDRYFGTYTTTKRLTIIADTENKNQKTVDGRGGFYGSFHQELEARAEVIYAPSPMGITSSLLAIQWI